MSRIDVVVPCYNYGRYLAACVGSVLEQSVDDLRVLIIDDASSDDSLSVARNLASGDRRVSVVSHESNRGHITTYNEGIRWAEGDYFLLLSADDLLAPGALSRALRIMDANSDVVMTYGDCLVWHDHHRIPAVHPLESFTWEYRNLAYELCSLATNTVPTPTAIVRTSVQKKIGGYAHNLPHAGDLEMWLRFAASGRVACIGAVQGIYRKHSTAMSNRYWKNMLAEYQQRKLAFDTFFSHLNDKNLLPADQHQKTNHILADKAFQSGVGYMRRGRLRGGAQLMRWAMTIDRRLRYLPPVWRIAKIPGREGRRWAVDSFKGAMANRSAGHRSY